MYAVVRLTRASQSTRWRPAAAWRLTEAAASASANHAQSICRGGHECATERATRTSSLREYAHLQHSRTFYSHSIWLHLRGRKRLTAGGDVDDGGSRSSSEATTAALPNHSREGTTTFAQEASVELQTPLPDSTLASSVCVNPSWSPSRAQELTQFDSSWRTGGSASSSPSYYHLALCARFFVFTIALSSARVWYEWVCHDECRPEECHSKRQLMEWTTTSLAHLRSGPQHWATLLTYALSHRSLDSLAANLAWVAAYSVGLGWRYGIVRTVAIGAASALAGGMTVCMTDSTSRVMGGSGVAFGLAAAYSATAVRDWTFTSFPHRVKLPFITAGIQVMGVTFFVAHLVPSVYRLCSGTSYERALADQSHIGGAIAGTILGLGLSLTPRARFRALPSAITSKRLFVSPQFAFTLRSLRQQPQVSSSESMRWATAASRIFPIRAWVMLEALLMAIMILRPNIDDRRWYADFKRKAHTEAVHK